MIERRPYAKNGHPNCFRTLPAMFACIEKPTKGRYKPGHLSHYVSHYRKGKRVLRMK